MLWALFTPVSVSTFCKTAHTWHMISLYTLSNQTQPTCTFYHLHSLILHTHDTLSHEPLNPTHIHMTYYHMNPLIQHTHMKYYCMNPLIQHTHDTLSHASCNLTQSMTQLFLHTLGNLTQNMTHYCIHSVIWHKTWHIITCTLKIITCTLWSRTHRTQSLKPTQHALNTVIKTHKTCN